jgi:circadian clock protein KaiC
MGSDNHLLRALEAMDSFKPDYLIVDAISACVRMGSERAAFDYLMRLVSIVKERGTTCILTNQSTSFPGGDEELSGIGFSSVVDAVIQLRFIEIDQQIDRQILVMKSRGAAHSNRRQPFIITGQGIQFPDHSPASIRASQSGPPAGKKVKE